MPSIALIVLLVLAGMVFIFFELMTPSFGVLAALALASLGGAVWMAFTISPTVGVVMVVAMVFGVPAYFVLLVRLLPKMPFGRKLFLEKTPSNLAAATPEAPRNESLIGQVGVTDTILRPAGVVRIAGQRVVALAESGVIDHGAKVKVISTDGMNVIVRKVE